jgi:AcrR family transcriptional regulator
MAAGKSREEAKQETREALLRAGMATFDEHGVDMPSLDAICERAGYTRGAFYVHFRDRDHFLASVINRATQEFVEKIIATSGESDALEQTVDRFVDAAAKGHLPLAQRRLLMQLMSRGGQPANRMRERFREMLEGARALLDQAARNGQEAGTVGKDLEADQVALWLLASAFGVMTLVDAGVEIDPDRMRVTARRLLGLKDPE